MVTLGLFKYFNISVYWRYIINNNNNNYIIKIKNCIRNIKFNNKYICIFYYLYIYLYKLIFII